MEGAHFAHSLQFLVYDLHEDAVAFAVEDTHLLLAEKQCLVEEAAQENPAPMPPNYERIYKETHRLFGEYRYKRLLRHFDRCDTAMTVDHFRCLYYGDAMRKHTPIKYTLCDRVLTDSVLDTADAQRHLRMVERILNEYPCRLSLRDYRYRLLCRLYGSAHPLTNQAWWQLQMLLVAVWSTGDGSGQHPFHVREGKDAYYMVKDMGLHPTMLCDGVCETKEGVYVYFIRPPQQHR